MRPDDYVTRAELSAILHRAVIAEELFGEAGTAYAELSDIDGHWAHDDIVALASKGVILGYTDGTFKPENAVTRAEAVAMLARLLGRSEDFTQSKAFADVVEAHWAYNEIMNAANGLLDE